MKAASIENIWVKVYYNCLPPGLGRVREAITAYETAISTLEEGSNQNSELMRKLTDAREQLIREQQKAARESLQPLNDDDPKPSMQDDGKQKHGKEGLAKTDLGED
jgi:hypothetical protein